jgi:hypothetical protein
MKRLDSNKRPSGVRYVFQLSMIIPPDVSSAFRDAVRQD